MVVRPSCEWKLEPFNVINGHPAYLDWVQIIPIDPITTDGIRVSVSEPQIGRDWSISEIELRGPRTE